MSRLKINIYHNIRSDMRRGEPRSSHEARLSFDEGRVSADSSRDAPTCY